MPPLPKAMRCFRPFPSAGSALARELGLVAVAVVMNPSLSECLARGSSDPVLHIAARRRLQRRVLGAARPRPRLYASAALAREPRVPVVPPAAGAFRGTREPVVGFRRQAVTGPVAALVLRGGIDDAGDVAARPEHEALLALDKLSRLVSRAPGNNVILARRQDIGRQIDLSEVDRRAEHRGRAGYAQLVLQIG